MTATATRHQCVPNTATLYASFDEPQTSTARNIRQGEVVTNVAGVHRESRGYQFLMSFLRCMSACHA